MADTADLTIMSDMADIGMSRTLSYFQSSVTPMGLRLPNLSKVSNSGLWTERKGQQSATSDPTISHHILGLIQHFIRYKI